MSRAHLRRGHAWPDGELERGAPAEARLVQSLVLRLAKAMSDKGDLAIIDVADMSGVNKSSISQLLRGETWGPCPSSHAWRESSMSTYGARSTATPRHRRHQRQAPTPNAQVPAAVFEATQDRGRCVSLGPSELPRGLGNTRAFEGRRPRCRTQVLGWRPCTRR